MAWTTPATGEYSPMPRIPRLTVEQILAWADAHHARTGRWPTTDSGPVQGHRKEKWVNIDRGLRQGLRGLLGGSSLPRLLAAKRGARNKRDLPPLTVDQILAWADAHHAASGAWPGNKSGPVAGQPGESWGCINECLRTGLRGLPGGDSLGRLLFVHRGKRYGSKPALSTEIILEWADRHRGRTGRWPNLRSGPVEDAPGETWVAINTALIRGARGLPGGESLSKLLKRQRGRQS